MVFRKEDFKVWCGGLPRDIEEDEIEDIFAKCGTVIEIKKRSSMKDTFCFVTFKDEAAVHRAMEDLDQKDVGGSKIKVSFARPEGAGPVHDKGKDKGKGKGRSRSRDKGKGKGYRDRSRSRGRDGYGKGKGNFNPHEVKVQIENLPRDMTWGELKDLGRTYVEYIAHSEVWWDGPTPCGSLKLKNRDDAEAIVSTLNGRRMKDIDGRLRVWIDKDGDGGGREDSFRLSSPRDRRDRSPDRSWRDDRGGGSYDWRRSGGSY